MSENIERGLLSRKGIGCDGWSNARRWNWTGRNTLRLDGSATPTPHSHQMIRGKGRMRLATYAVKVEGFDEKTYSAMSASKARAECWRDYTSAFDISFKEFLKISRVYKCGLPPTDGYDYIRRAYGVDPKVGQRVRLKDEGSYTGREGEVAYPGETTAHVHVLLDGEKHVSHVHPNSIEVIA